MPLQYCWKEKPRGTGASHPTPETFPRSDRSPYLPTSDSSSDLPTAPPVPEASEAVATSLTSAPKKVWKRQLPSIKKQSSLRALSCWSADTYLPPIHFQMTWAMLIPARLNWSTCTHLPATTWSHLRGTLLLDKTKHVVCRSFTIRSADTPSTLVEPSKRAPSSCTCCALTTRFFSDDMTPAWAQASSAAQCSSAAPPPISPGPNRSPEKKLSK